MSIFKEVGKNIRNTRKGARLTLQEVAELTGFSAATISNIERGLQDVKVSQLEKLGGVFSVRPEDFFRS